MTTKTELDQLLLQAKELFDKAEYDKLIALLSDSILNKMKHAPLYAWRAWAHDRSNETEKTFSYSNKAIELDSSFDDSYRIRGNAWSKKKDIDNAIADYTKAIELNSKNYFAYCNRGNTYLEKKDFEKALIDFNKAIEIMPNEGHAFRCRGDYFILKGDFDNAILDYNKAIELSPNDNYGYLSRGDYYERKGEYDKALIDFNKAIELNPTEANSYIFKGNLHYYNGESEKSINDYDNAIKHSIDDTITSMAYGNRGNAYANIGNTKKAIEDLTEAIRLNPKNSFAYNNLALIHKTLGNINEAIKELQNAIDHDQENFTAFKNLGDILFEQGKYNEALQEYEKAFKIRPHDDYYKSLRDKAKAKLGEEVLTSPLGERKDSTINTAEYIERLLSPLTNETDKRKIRITWVDVSEVISRIRKLLLYTSQEEIVHYTRIKTADIVARAKPFKLRYSNVVFMNDPEEGDVFLKYLNDKNVSDALCRVDNNDDNNIYLGSFLPENKKDYLIMWRTYGKNELNDEATGCSFLIKPSFFDSQDSGSLYANTSKSGQKPENSINELHSQSLYKVVYYDKETMSLQPDTGLNLPKLIKEIVNFKEKLRLLIDIREPNDIENREKKNSIIDGLVYRFISELRYFFKSSEYQFEKELRVIKYYPLDDSKVNTDLITNEIPRKLFIESTKDLQPHLSEIILGPKVIHPERYLYIESQLRKYGYTTLLKRSELRYQ